MKFSDSQFEKTIPLKLTVSQRDTLLDSTQLDLEVERRLSQAQGKTLVVEMSVSELDALDNELFLISEYVRHPQKQRIVAIHKKVTHLLQEVRQAEFGIQSPKTPPSEVSNLCFQFKIILSDIRPAIWRRIRVSDCSLLDFHQFLQAAFGWENYHMHQFEIDGERYETEPEDYGFGTDSHDESDVLLSELLVNYDPQSPWKYLYDFGDGWQHRIAFEGYATHETKAPLCTEGERACPPEDIGGPWGYVDYLEAIADPKHESHAHLLEWGGPFDPEAFDAKQATHEMRGI